MLLSQEETLSRTSLKQGDPPADGYLGKEGGEGGKGNIHANILITLTLKLRRVWRRSDTTAQLIWFHPSQRVDVCGRNNLAQCRRSGVKRKETSGEIVKIKKSRI